MGEKLTGACVQVDPGNTGRVGPTEAALFLKKSGLPDITLGKVGGVCVSVCSVLTVLPANTEQQMCTLFIRSGCSLWILMVY